MWNGCYSNPITSEYILAKKDFSAEAKKLKLNLNDKLKTKLNNELRIRINTAALTSSNTGSVLHSLHKQ